MGDDALRKYLPASLAKLVEKAGLEQGIRFQDLPPDADVVVETEDGTYAVAVLDPARSHLTLSGGGLTAPKTTYFQGSLVHPLGSMIMSGQIKMDCCLEFGGILDRVVTAPVRRVTVNGIQVLPQENRFRQ